MSVVLQLLIGLNGTAMGCVYMMKTPSKNLVGTWELISIDGKTLKTDSQKDMEDLKTEVLGIETKIVLASDGTLF